MASSAEREKAHTHTHTSVRAVAAFFPIQYLDAELLCMHDAWVKSLLNIQTHIHSWQNVGKQLSQGKADTGTLPYLHVSPNTLPTALDCQPFPALTWFGLFILSLLVGISLQLDKFLELCDRLEHIVCALPGMFRWSFGHCRRISAAGWNLVLGKSISECDSCSHRYIVVRGFSRWRQQRTCLLEQQQRH